MKPGETITVLRDCMATQVPSGIPFPVRAGIKVRIMQSLGGSYTVMTDQGYMGRIDAKDADALGLTPENVPDAAGEFSENLVWDQLRTIYDPEIPVNVVDLGLIYDCKIAPVPEGNQIEIKMTMTAPGCGMADVLKNDVERRLAGLPSVTGVHVEVVFDPPWNPTRMSEAARLQLGLDLDAAAFPMYGRY
jgi:probable FeS assembly SUF system protein SufT